jgi:glycosyltransferase involved in cell wall biosynthesis
VISICVPVFNGAEWIADAIRSALAQTRTDFELLIVDNGSTDDSLAIARTFEENDSRVRVERFVESVGAVANHNYCLQLARGSLIKFLHQDDSLRADCLEKMAAIFEEAPDVGLVFSRREVVLDEPDDPEAQAWARTYGTLHGGFGELGRVNRGSELLRRWLPTLGGEDFENWIGEPSATMLRASVLKRVGPLNPRVWQAFDIELWLRVIAVSDVGFVDQPLVCFRHHKKSLSAHTAAGYKEWLDRLWLLDALLEAPGFDSYRGMLYSFRRRELVRVARKQAAQFARGKWDLRPLLRYPRYRLRRR